MGEIKDKSEKPVCECGEDAVGLVQYVTGNLIHRYDKKKKKFKQVGKVEIVELCGEQYFCKDCKENALNP